MVYIMGHRPYEFGLVPDHDGFLSYKELLWGIHEEPGWRYVRQSHIREVLIGKDRSLFDWSDKGIRTHERRWSLDLSSPADRGIPKILHIGIRRKAHAHVMEKGLAPPPGQRLHVLTPDRDMALRIARRRDSKPVLLEITTAASPSAGMLFFPFGDLYLTEKVPARHIVGPPPPRETRRAAPSASAAKEGKRPYTEAGTFILDLEKAAHPNRRSKGRKRKGWKEEARKIRKSKTR
jgi:putative RNA 2'-phosphotransferase